MARVRRHGRRLRGCKWPSWSRKWRRCLRRSRSRKALPASREIDRGSLSRRDHDSRLDGAELHSRVSLIGIVLGGLTREGHGFGPAERLTEAAAPGAPARMRRH